MRYTYSEQQIFRVLNKQLLEIESNESATDSIKKLAKHYEKKENRTKFINLLDKKVKEHTKWIKSIESKIDSKILKNIKKEIDAKVKENESKQEKYTLTQLLKDAVAYTKEAVFPSFKRSKGRVADRILSRMSLVYLLSLVAAVNGIIMGICMVSIGPLWGRRLGAVISAPITEELYKYLSIKLDEKEFGWFFFNVSEWYYYVKTYGGFSISNIPFMIVRVICTMLHLINTKIHADEKLGSEGFRFKLAALIHAMWNGPISIISGLVISIGARLFGVWGMWISAFAYLTGAIKIILKSVSSLHTNKSVEADSNDSEPIPQPA